MRNLSQTNRMHKTIHSREESSVPAKGDRGRARGADDRSSQGRRGPAFAVCLDDQVQQDTQDIDGGGRIALCHKLQRKLRQGGLIPGMLPLAAVAVFKTKWFVQCHCT